MSRETGYTKYLIWKRLFEKKHIGIKCGSYVSKICDFKWKCKRFFTAVQYLLLICHTCVIKLWLNWNTKQQESDLLRAPNYYLLDIEHSFKLPLIYTACLNANSTDNHGTAPAQCKANLEYCDGNQWFACQVYKVGVRTPKSAGSNGVPRYIYMYM